MTAQGDVEVPGSPPSYPYIDCLRGYAVLMVITCHVSGTYPQLPFPVQRFVSLGWHGVQLFFLASAMTLLMSWNFRGGGIDAERIMSFFVRRIFRIVPAYYAAALLYLVVRPPLESFTFAQLVTAMTFTNGWSPDMVPTVPGAWYLVPGEWSVAVEFTFYAVFPLFAAFTTNIRRALMVFALSLFAGAVINRFTDAALRPFYEAGPLKEFLYFWFPNQMAVFALGGVLYFLERLLRQAATPQPGGPVPIFSGPAAFLARHGNLCPIVAMIGLLGCGQVPLPHWTGQGPPYLSGLILISLWLGLFVLALALAQKSWFLNRFAAAMGRISFSAYLLHFAVLQLAEAFPAVSHIRSTGMTAIAAFSIAWWVVVLITFGLSTLSYHAIELPMIKVGKRLLQRRTVPALGA